MRAPRTHSGSTGRSGFTLVELLLVLVITGLMVALLFPVLGAARKKSRLAVCSSNLRQIGMAYQVYESDYEALPRSRRELVLGGYLKDARILYCPDEHQEKRPGFTSTSSYVYRNLVPPTFRPVWEMRDLSPSTVLVECDRHQERREYTEGDAVKQTVPKYPFSLVLRAGGTVNQIRADRILRVPVPNSDQPIFEPVYPGEPGYDRAQR